MLDQKNAALRIDDHGPDAERHATTHERVAEKEARRKLEAKQGRMVGSAERYQRSTLATGLALRLSRYRGGSFTLILRSAIGTRDDGSRPYFGCSPRPPPTVPLP